LFTFKSFQQALDAWAMKELAGHSVNYRKQVSPSLNQLLPEEDFRLFAVCARFPQGLAERLKDLPPEERMKGLPPEERVKGMSVEELARALSSEEIRALWERVRKETPGQAE
jgi:hypothetical protein